MSENEKKTKEWKVKNFSDVIHDIDEYYYSQIREQFGEAREQEERAKYQKKTGEVPVGGTQNITMCG